MLRKHWLSEWLKELHVGGTTMSTTFSPFFSLLIYGDEPFCFAEDFPTFSRHAPIDGAFHFLGKPSVPGHQGWLVTSFSLHSLCFRHVHHTCGSYLNPLGIFKTKHDILKSIEKFGDLFLWFISHWNKSDIKIDIDFQCLSLVIWQVNGWSANRKVLLFAKSHHLPEYIMIW